MKPEGPSNSSVFSAITRFVVVFLLLILIAVRHTPTIFVGNHDRNLGGWILARSTLVVGGEIDSSAGRGQRMIADGALFVVMHGRGIPRHSAGYEAMNAEGCHTNGQHVHAYNNGH